MEKKLTIKGHKLKTYWSGVGDNYANGSCECRKWHYRGWTERMRNVRTSHQGHLKRIEEKTPILNIDI